MHGDCSNNVLIVVQRVWILLLDLARCSFCQGALADKSGDRQTVLANLSCAQKLVHGVLPGVITPLLMWLQSDYSGSALQIEVCSTSHQDTPVHACFESREEGLGVSISALQQHTAELSTWSGRDGVQDISSSALQSIHNGCHSLRAIQS